jgi:hypothetical protein
MPSDVNRRTAAGLLILRLFLGIFLLQWSIEKLILPNATIRIAQHFYGTALPVVGSYMLGAAELVLSLIAHSVTSLLAKSGAYRTFARSTEKVTFKIDN